MDIPTEILRKSLGASSDVAMLWFESRSEIKPRKVFEDKGKLGDNGKGAVYVYYKKGGKVLYVGQTKRKIKARLHDKTSPHKKRVSGISGWNCPARPCEVIRFVWLDSPYRFRVS